jgi:regulator of sirC expression with transglutaminase-like and TPR domain
MSSTTWQQNFHQEINQPDEQISLAKAALYFAQAEYPDLDVDQYLNVINRMAAQVKERLPDNRYPLKVIQTLNQYLFTNLGFRGNTDDYYDPGNSFLNQAIERRTGIPITLSVIYLEVAQGIEFPMVGIGMPGHFLIRPDFEDAGIFVDAFNRGEVLFRDDCEERLRQVYQQPVKLEPKFLAPVSNRQILARMLTNLKFIYINRQEFAQALRSIELILQLFPQNPREIRDRGLLYYQAGEFHQACQDLAYYLAMFPDGEDAPTIRHLLDKIS